MAFEYSKLRGRIIEKCDSQNNFAELVGISTVALSQKMNGKIGISREDIVKWAEVLDISPDEYAEYFFAVKP